MMIAFPSFHVHSSLDQASRLVELKSFFWENSLSNVGVQDAQANLILPWESCGLFRIYGPALRVETPLEADPKSPYKL